MERDHFGETVGELGTSKHHVPSKGDPGAGPGMGYPGQQETQFWSWTHHCLLEALSLWRPVFNTCSMGWGLGSAQQTHSLQDSQFETSLDLSILLRPLAPTFALCPDLSALEKPGA